MPIRPDADVKSWVVRAIRRWVRLQDMGGWTITVSMEDSDVLGEDVYGRCGALPQYRSAHIYLLEDIQNDEDGRHTVYHECRHPHYEGIMNRLDIAWDGRRKVTKEQAVRMFREEIEMMVERDVEMMRRLKLLK